MKQHSDTRCGQCRFINGVCLNQGFCDRHFRPVTIDRIACEDFLFRQRVGRGSGLAGKLTEDQKMFLRANYATMPRKRLAALFCVSESCLRHTCKALGIPLRQRGQRTEEGKRKSADGLREHFNALKDQPCTSLKGGD